uniref:Uncharacterized protein n=1 Tax=Seriola lalandi dorsalis TaxID=1841481 RepID=A0A3B4Y7J0_SERLL
MATYMPQVCAQWPSTNISGLIQATVRFRMVFIMIHLCLCFCLLLRSCAVDPISFFFSFFFFMNAICQECCYAVISFVETMYIVS